MNGGTSLLRRDPLGMVGALVRIAAGKRALVAAVGIDETDVLHDKLSALTISMAFPALSAPLREPSSRGAQVLTKLLLERSPRSA